jgi:hypothetical protein
MPRKPNAFIIALADTLRETGIGGTSPIAKTGE